MRTIAAVTSSRADYGIYRPVLRRIEDDSELDLAVVATGVHLTDGTGMTADDIAADGFAVREHVAVDMASDGPAGMAATMGAVTSSFAALFDRWRPDILLLQGDRFELHAVAVAALPFAIPIAHMHGGEVTEGAMDDALRHAMTKMAHLHFVATEGYGRRVRQLGEEAWRVTVSGAPSLDNIAAMDLPGRDEIAREFDLDLAEPPLLITFHPVTREYGRTSDQIAELLSALDGIGAPMVFTAPNADMGADAIRAAIDDFADAGPRRWMIENLGTRNYFGLMKAAAAMVGNSSSGIIEAASFALPVVDVGSRQAGREHAPNVIDTPCREADIRSAIDRACSENFRRPLDGLENPFGDGCAAVRIVDVLKTVPLDERLAIKRFADMRAGEAARDG
jgi:UDP-hydrolysing UDP-N-acetyl-D-glucosamine 2-epimerase